MIKVGNICMYLHEAGVLFSGMSRDQANARARDYGLKIDWQGRRAPKMKFA